MMTPWFIWKGKNSFADFGLWVRKLPKRTRAKERHEQIVIPGRAGSLIMTEGEDVYDAYSGEMIVSCKNTINLDRVKEWLRGSGELILSDDLSKAYTARIVNEVPFDREEKDKLFVGTIPFLFQPFRKGRYPERDERVILSGTSGTLFNPGDVASRPIVRIIGSGDNQITIAGQTMAFENLPGPPSYPVEVDCDAQIVTRNGEIWGERVTGAYWQIPRGPVTVEQTGSATIMIDPQWRWL